MKFNYENLKPNTECVAYIDGDGDLVIKDGNGAITICQDGCHLNNERWSPYNADHKFYPGDKLEITF